MREKVKEFEKAAIEAVAALRYELGAKCVDVNIHIDDFEKGCKTDVMFYKSIPSDAKRVPGCGPACKGD
jgi:hypothetical protein